MDRHSDGQTASSLARWTDTHMDRQLASKMDRRAPRPTDTQMDRQTDTQMDRQLASKMDRREPRPTDTQMDTQLASKMYRRVPRPTDTQMDRHPDGQTARSIGRRTGGIAQATKQPMRNVSKQPNSVPSNHESPIHPLHHPFNLPPISLVLFIN